MDIFAAARAAAAAVPYRIAVAVHTVVVCDLVPGLNDSKSNDLTNTMFCLDKGLGQQE